MATVIPPVESEIFLQLPDEDGRRVLHPTRVTEHTDAGLVLVTGAVEEGLEEGATRTAYFKVDGRFVKQPATLRSVAHEVELDGFFLTVELLGEPVDAEARQAFRVSCVGCAITATLGHETDCMVIDTSATGFGVYATQLLGFGDLVDVELHHGGETVRGRCSVQSIRRVGGDTVRYGMVAVDGDGDRGLVKALPRVNAKLQREQMRRVR